MKGPERILLLPRKTPFPGPVTAVDAWYQDCVPKFQGPMQNENAGSSSKSRKNVLLKI